MTRPLAVLGLAGVFVAGCGNSSSPSNSTASTAPAATTSPTTSAETTTTSTPAGSSKTYNIGADPNKLAFTVAAIGVKAGDVTFKFTNPSSKRHNLSIRASDGTPVGASETISGGSTTFNVTLTAGTDYVFYCSIPGHEAGGMVGGIRVFK